MEKKFDDNEEMQIDLLELAYALKKKLWLIILGLIAGALGAGIYSKAVITPVYTSTAMVYVLSKETTLTSLADLQIGSQLTKDYSVLVTSRPVLSQVIEKQNLNMSVGELKSKISISNPSDTRVLSITISDTDPIRAQALAEEVARTSSDYIGDIMEMVPPKIIEEGVPAAYPSSPNVKKNAAMGGLAVAVVISGVICLQVIMDDTIKTEEDVEKYLGMSVLASVPDVEETGRAEKDKKRKKKKTKGAV